MTKEDTDTFMELQEKRDNIYIDFLKQILIMSSALLGILASLHTPDSHQSLFLFVILSLSLSILSGGTSLLGFVIAYRTLFDKFRLRLVRKLSNSSSPLEPVSYKPLGIFDICAVISFVSFVAAIICLAIYAVKISI